MTEPTWKDELLQRWWSMCSEEERRLLTAWATDACSDYTPALALADLCISVALNNSKAIAEAGRTLRSLIDAELATASASEFWRTNAIAWQDWAADLLMKHGLQLEDGQHGNESARAILEAELARGREAVEVLREADGASGRCPVCTAGLVFGGHAPDCRLAKVIA